MGRKSVFIFAIIIILSAKIFADNDNTSATGSNDEYEYKLNGNDSSSLKVKIPAQVFFTNNEFKRKIAYGYTLGGVRINPLLEYQPLGNLSFRIGLNFIRYWGADSYGAYNFIHIPYYTDKNIQHQIHWKPYFRVNWQINNNLNFLAGNIFCQNNHFLNTALFNPELQFTTDPQEGLQLLYCSKYWDNDIWVNWQNFNFMNDIDREEFLLGDAGRIKADFKKKTFFDLNYSVQWQHHGGELDTITTMELDHWINSSVGISVLRKFNTDFYFNNIKFNFDYLVSKSLKNDTWYFKSGYALFPKISLQDGNQHSKIDIGYYYSKDFVSLYGAAFFSNIAQRDKNIYYPGNKMIYASFYHNIDLDENNKTNRYSIAFFSEWFYKLDDKNSYEKESKSISFSLGFVLKALPEVYVNKKNNNKLLK